MQTHFANKIQMKSLWAGLLLAGVLTLTILLGLHPARELRAESSQAGSSNTLRVDVELITVEVIAQDKKGKPIQSLKKEDIMEALQAPGNLNEIPIQLSYNYFQVDEARYQIALLTKVNIQGLQFLEENARHKNLFNLIVVAFDEHDTYVDGLEKSMELNLTDPSYAAMLNYGFTSKVDIKVPPGRYKIRAVVREGNRTRMGSVRKTIEVP